MARSLVFRFRHEQENGRTSSVATEVMGFTGESQVAVDTRLTRAACFQAVHTKADHTITLVDLCGHERYLKTTVFGLTALVPDYAMVIVGANMGVSRMTKVRSPLSPGRMGVYECSGWLILHVYCVMRRSTSASASH